MLLPALQLRSPIGPYVVRLTSAYCTKYKDSYESAHLLSAGLYLALGALPLVPLQVLQTLLPRSRTPQALTLGSAGSSGLAPHSAPALSAHLQYIHGTIECCTP